VLGDLRREPRDRASRISRVRLHIVLAIVSSGPLIGACGSSTKPSVSTSQDLKFAVCMRSHGVPNFPDPGAHGSFIGGPGSAIDPFSPAFRSAQRGCGQGPGTGGPPMTSERERLAALAFSKCMRMHGLGNFPDPTFTAPTGTGPMLVLRGMAFAIGPGLDPRSPAFSHAAAACGLGQPVGARTVRAGG
jgi:hypothetical protein